mgnify:CR=1 FL=1
MNLITAEHLTHSYTERLLLDDTSFSLGENEKVGIIGINGTGKSTLLKILAGIVEPDSGKITMGRNLRIGYLSQKPEFANKITALEAALPLKKDIADSPANYEPQAKNMMNKLGFKNHTQPIEELSGGQRKRIALIRTLLTPADILILDEPTAGLDPNERIRFRNLISELSEDRLVLLSTHIVSDIEYIANEIWLMKDGEILHKGSIEELINSMTETVWECLVPKNRVSDFMEKYKISNMKSEINQIMLRIISHEKPVENAMRVEASLEDVFLYYFGEKAGDENATL